MIARIVFAGFRGVTIGLVTMPYGKVRVMGSGGRILRFETPLRFLVMIGCFLIMVGSIMMMAGRRMLTGHARTRPPE